MTRYSVTGQLAIARGADGQQRYLYRGAPLPADLPAGEVARLLALGLVAAVPAPAAGGLPWSTAWRARLASRATAPVDVLVFGNSVSEGWGATAFSTRWTSRLQDLLRLRYPTAGVVGGEGFVNAFSQQPTWAAGWTYGGAISGNSQYGLGHRCVVLSSGSPAGFAERSCFGTSVVVGYLKQTGLGALEVLVDGTVAATVNTAAGADGTVRGGGRATVSLGTRGAHTVRVRWASGAAVYVNGFHVRDGDEASGIRVVESAQSGTQSSAWTVATNPLHAPVTEEISATQPALVVIELGANDRTAGSPPDALATNLAALTAQVNGACTLPPSVLLLGAYLEGAGDTAWSEYLASMRNLADGSPAQVGMLDLTASMPPSTDTALGLYYTDAQHPSDRGHSFIADRVAEVLR